MSVAADSWSPSRAATDHSTKGALDQQGHYSEADKLFRETLELQREVLGPEVPEDIAADEDLKSLHGDPQFEELLTRARNRFAKSTMTTN